MNRVVIVPRHLKPFACIEWNDFARKLSPIYNAEVSVSESGFDQALQNIINGPEACLEWEVE